MTIWPGRRHGRVPIVHGDHGGQPLPSVLRHEIQHHRGNASVPTTRTLCEWQVGVVAVESNWLDVRRAHDRHSCTAT